METPYASIILPTHSRASTLACALTSVQQQSLAQIEILIALDGATSECRAIAGAAASADHRIRVLDLPKGPGGAYQSVDAAVKQARAQRIFYIDDDDLFLPDHVSTLGPLLDNADIVESRVCSLDRAGKLNLSPCRTGNGRMRELLAGGRLKLLYDTHIAHRRDAYGRIARWTAPGGARGPVWSFLGTFASSPDCRWSSCDQVTALSLHGAARSDMPPMTRQREIENALAWMPQWRKDADGAGSLYHFFQLLAADPPGTLAFEDYLTAHGAYDDAIQSGKNRMTFGVFAADPPPESIAELLALELCEPVESGYACQQLALAYFEAFGQEAHERILRNVAERPGPNHAARLAAYALALGRRDAREAARLARLAAQHGPDALGTLAAIHELLQSRVTP